MAMENTATPTALIFSRQNITDLPAKGNRYDEALQAEKGAYIVESDENPDVIMVASGSEVSTLEEGAALLRADGIKVRIVSVPSEGLFRSQSKRISGICHSQQEARYSGLLPVCRSIWKDWWVPTVRCGDSNHSVSPLRTRYWTKNSASRVRTYTIR